MKNSPDAIAITDVDGKLIEVSDSFLKLFGIDINNKGSIIGKNGFDLISVNEFKRTKQNLEKLLEQGYLQNEEAYFQKHDGTRFWGELNLKIVLDDLYIPKYIIASIRDISKRKELKDTSIQKDLLLKESELKFSDLMNNINVGITSLDKDGIFKLVNVEAAKNLGGTPEDIIGKSIRDFFPEDVVERSLKRIQGIFKTGKGIQFEETFQLKTGTKTFFINEQPLRNLNGNIIEVFNISIDLTGRKKFEQKLKESEHDYRRIYETAQVGLWTSLIKGALIIKANNKGAQILGLKDANEVINTKITDYFAPEISTAIYQELKQSGEVSNYEGQLVDVNGIEKIVSISARLFERDNGEEYIEGYIFDITDLKKAQEALKESEEKFRLFADQSHMGIAVVQDDSMKYVNEALSKINEYSIEEMMNWTPIDYLKTTHPEDIPAVMERIKRRQAGEKGLPPSFTCRLITKSGKKKWIESYGKTILYNGKYADYGSIIDITDRMEMHNRLRESQEMLQLVMDNIPQFIFWKDKDSRYMGCNKNFARVAGVNVPEYIVGLKDKDLAWEKEEAEFFHETDALVMESDAPEFHIIEQQLQADGKHAWLDTNKIPLHDSEGNVVGLLGTYEDITERVISEQALKKSEVKYREAYNNANFLKDIFSHDINNILQGIQTANELYSIAIEHNNFKELKELTEVIKLQVIRGAKLVNTIQKLSELEEYEQIFEPVVIKNILDQSIKNVKNLFQNKEIDIKIKSLNSHDVVSANEFLLDIFENLLINSVMFNENQKIEIEIAFSKEIIDNKAFLRIEFRDNGTGIEEIRKSIIFQRAYNKDKTISGLGLGLSLVKKVIDTYNGKIWVEDKVKGDHSKGSNFILLIPEAQ